jgi:hypothetical protein
MIQHGLCPMCDSVVELTEIGVVEAAKDAANKAKWATTEDEGAPVVRV